MGNEEMIYICSMRRLKLLIIDEHIGVGNVLARRLSSISDFEVVGATGNAEEGLLQITTLLPDMVLLDIKMTQTDGLEVCRRASSLAGGAKVAVLTSYGDLAELRQVQNAGASGYFLKNVDTHGLANQIRQLAEFPAESYPDRT